ncbi:MAG TPA: hypothetical protein VGG53_13870 [Mycobacterium sp.]|uniref:hypothetical protein n=1 Tax=Mycobacterium sp. TaxID=1785 RepID=UPI002F4276B9
MSYFGIPHYEPHWRSGRRGITAADTSRLESLSGRQLTDSWLVWDRKYGKWLADCPVVLNFDGEQVEICHQKFDDLSITWNTIVPTAPIEWYDGDDKTLGSDRLDWRNDADARLAALSGRQLKAIALLEWCGDSSDFGNGAPAISFDFGPEQVTIANGLDENTLGFRQPHSQYRIHRLNN